jgi:hypothetical protein
MEDIVVGGLEPQAFKAERWFAEIVVGTVTFKATVRRVAKAFNWQLDLSTTHAQVQDMLKALPTGGGGAISFDEAVARCVSAARLWLQLHTVLAAIAELR